MSIKWYIRYISFTGQATVHFLISFDGIRTEVHSANEGGSRPEMVPAQKRRGPKDRGEGRGFSRAVPFLQ